MSCPLNTPPVISSIVDGDGEITVTWGAVAGTTGYILKYGIVSGVYLAEIEVGNVLTYTVTGLEIGTTYYFVVSGIYHNIVTQVDFESDFSDSSSNHLTPTLVNTPVILGSSPIIGVGSGSFDFNDYVTYIPVSSMDIASSQFDPKGPGDYYFGVKVSFSYLPAFGSGNNVSIFSVARPTTFVGSYFTLRVISEVGVVDGNHYTVHWEWSPAAGNNVTTNHNTPLALNTVYFFEIERIQGAVYLKIDGVVVASDVSGLYNEGAFSMTSDPALRLTLGSPDLGGTSIRFSGKIDSFLFINGAQCESDNSSEVSVTGIDIVCGQVGVAVSSVINLDHLEGQTVAILANGEVLDQQIVSDGEIVLDDNYSKVSIGLPYVSDLETLNIEVPLKDGTAQGRKVKIGNVIFRIVDTLGGWVGPNKDVLYDAFPDAILDKNGGVTPTDLFSGDIRMPLGSGYEDGGRIFYRQYDPLPVSINAVIPETSVGGSSG